MIIACRKQTALLTIEFKFHKPLDPLAPPGTLPDPPLVFLTHRNLCSSSLLPILQSLVKERVQNASKKSKVPPSPPATNGAHTSAKESSEWLQALVIPSPEDPEGFAPPMCVLRAPLDPLVAASALQRPNPTPSPFQPSRPTPVIKKAYYKLDPDQPFLTALKHTQFVEFPTIEVFDPLSFKGALVDRDGRVSNVIGEDEDLDGREPKRRRLNKKEGKKRIGGLVGGYGSASGSEVEDEEEEKEKRNVLSMLGEYSDSDDGEGDVDMGEGEKVDGEADADVDAEGDVVSEGEDDEEAEGELEPAALVELLKKVRADTLGVGADDEEVLDWDDGDLSDADAEGEDDPGDEEDEGGYFR